MALETPGRPADIGVTDAPMQTLARNGIQLCVDDRGEGDPAFVFVHGWCCDHTYFAPQLDHFGRGHRVIGIDQRGFGASDKPEQDYTIEGFADDLAWICGELEVERPVIVGHSLGGAVTLAAAARHPDLPAAIVLCDPALFLPADGPFAEVVAALASEQYRAVAEHFVASQLFIESDDPARRARIVEQMLATPQHVMHSAFQHLGAFDGDAAARACRVPLLAIDAANPILDRERLRAACPQLRTAETPAVGHFHQLLAPGEVNRLIEEFVGAELGAGR
jgi:pimeloyl-ACP methyl ester carboxylesterase